MFWEYSDMYGKDKAQKEHFKMKVGYYSNCRNQSAKKSYLGTEYVANNTFLINFLYLYQLYSLVGD